MILDSKEEPSKITGVDRDFLSIGSAAVELLSQSYEFQDS